MFLDVPRPHPAFPSPPLLRLLQSTSFRWPFLRKYSTCH
jgi:hypothetical protein